MQRRCQGEGLRVGGPGTPPFWRTRLELCKPEVRNSMTLKRIGFFCFPINTQTHFTTVKKSFDRVAPANCSPARRAPVCAGSLVALF